MNDRRRFFDRLKPNGVVNQYLAAIIANFSTLSFTIGIGWASPNLPLLRSEQTPLQSGPLSDTEISWIASMLNVGGLFGSIFFGLIVDRIGRRLTLMLMGVLEITCWLLIAYGQNFYMLIAGRFLCGFCGGGNFVVVPLYVLEVSQTCRRGLLGSIVMLLYNLGILVGYITGGFFSYTSTPNVALFFSAIFFVGFYFLPETPHALWSKNRRSEALAALRYFRRGVSTEIEIQREMDVLTNGGDQKDDGPSTPLRIQDFMTKSARKGLFISFYVISMTQLCGVLTIITYLSEILAEAKSGMLPLDASIIVAAIQVLGAILTILLVDRLGRRALYTISSIGTGTCLAIVGVYYLLNSQQSDLSDFSLAPLFGLCGVVIFASMGFITIPYVVISEVCSQKTRSMISSAAISWSWILAFILLKFYYTITESIGIYGYVFIFSAFCFGTLLFIICLMPETKGKSVDEIIAILDK